MSHPTPEQLKPLLDALDVACWAWAVKSDTKKGQSCKVDWKAALDELCEAWGQFEIAIDDRVAVPSQATQDDELNHPMDCKCDRCRARFMPDPVQAQQGEKKDG